MKFKVDENLPVEVAQLLREAGHDAITVLEQEMGGAKDQAIARACQDEQRALVTLDTHFSDIRTYPPKEFSGLIVLRLSRQDKSHVLQVTKKVIQMFASRTADQQLWIVDEDKTRIRS